jgi:glucoamylase
MTKFREAPVAPGWPGLEPWWTRGDKEGVATAYAPSSHVWATIQSGILTEAYYPTVDRPQMRDLQYLISDGQSFWVDELRLDHEIRRLGPQALGYQITATDPEGRFRLRKELVTDPHLPCILMRTQLEPTVAYRDRIRLYALCAPHLNGLGWRNSGYILPVSGQEILIAEHGGVWLALGASIPFHRLCVGYVGASDTWTDFARHGRMTWTYAQAEDGHVALAGELLPDGAPFTLGLAFGGGLHAAVTTLFQALGIPWSKQKERFLDQWTRPFRRVLPLARQSGDGGALYWTSVSLLLSHEDKEYPGAMIASLSIPWGEAKNSQAEGGYHFVWTRDLVHSATGLLAAGNTATPLRALIYLATSQGPDGGFPQNFWIDGEPHWKGIQLDQTAFPILLAWRLWHERALADFDPYPMVLKAAVFLLHHGPVTHQERWEENAGYSPSTLAVQIAALICAASFAWDRGDQTTAHYLEAYADFLERNVERWTVTSEGTLLPDVRRHYMRIQPVDPQDPSPHEDPNVGRITLANRPPGGPYQFEAKEIIDAGFLELVRYGIRRADDPLVVDSVKVVDAFLRVETPVGPGFRRYNHDGYGQRPDGGPYVGWGQGRAWPLLTGERAHYELAAGRPVAPYLRALESFASPTGMLPEQIWDETERPEQGLFLGGPTGAATPLMWAHAEYIKLLRSLADGRPFDLIPPVYRRYVLDRSSCLPIEIWKLNRQPRTVEPGLLLRVQADRPFRLRWTTDDWANFGDLDASSNALGIFWVDLPYLPAGYQYQFTFYWKDQAEWAGQNYQVAVTPHSAQSGKVAR